MHFISVPYFHYKGSFIYFEFTTSNFFEDSRTYKDYGYEYEGAYINEPNT